MAVLPLDDPKSMEAATSQLNGDEKKIAAASDLQRTDSDANSGENAAAAAAAADTQPIEYPGAFKLTLLLLATALSVFIVSLDTTIVSTAIPRITDEFHSLQDEAWYGSGFFMTMAAFQSCFGKAYKYFSIKPVFFISILIFEIGSLICAVAPNSPTLIVGRAIAGIGGAGTASGCYLIIGLSAPPEKVPALLGIVGACFAVAAVVGPLLGGIFTEHVSWRWCFYINLPIGGLTLLVILFFFSAPTHVQPVKASRKEKLLQMDPIGIILILGALISLTLALQWGGASKPWQSGDVIGTLVTSIVLFIAFAVWEARIGERASINARILRSNRTISLLMAFQFLINGCIFIALYFLPLYFQGVKGFDPSQSGIKTIPLLGITAGGAVIAGLVYMFTGEWQAPTVLGSMLVAVGCGLLYTLNSMSPESQTIGYQCVVGVGLGFTVQVAITVGQVVADAEDLSVVSAMALFFQLVGGAVWITVAQSVFVNRLAGYLSAQFNVSRATVVAAGATGGRQGLSGTLLDTVVEGYVLGLRDVWILCVALAGAATAVALLHVVVDRRKLPKGTLLAVPA